MTGRVLRGVAGVLLLLVGGVWLFQGLGALRGSVMTGSPFWAWVGAACVVAAVVLLVGLVRRRR